MSSSRPDLELSLCKELSREMGASLEEIISIVKTQFKFTSETVANSGFETVALPYLGKFRVKPGRLFKLNESMMEKRLIKAGIKWESSKKKTTKS